MTPQTHPQLDALVGYAIHYFRDFVLPEKRFREPSDAERAALIDLRDALSNLSADAPAERIQDVVYEVGRRPPFLDEKKKAKDGKPGVSLDWFNLLYQVLLGQEKGPRFGSFAAVYGLDNTIGMIDGALARSTVSNDGTRQEHQEPLWLRATVADFANFDFETPIAGSESADSNELGELYRAAASAGEDNVSAANAAEVRVFSMLSAVLEMRLKPGERNDPFGPMAVHLDGRRSAIPGDFRGRTEMLAELAERAQHPVLRARLADVCWLLERKRAQLGTIAVAAYFDIVKKVDAGELKFRFDSGRGAFKHDARDLLRRTLQICRTLGWDKAQSIATRELVVELRTKAIQQTQIMPTLWFSGLDLDFGISDPSVVAADVERLAAAPPAGTEPSNLVELWRLAARAYQVAKNDSAKFRCQSNAAEQLASIAENQSSAMLASHWLSGAIAELHGVPDKKERRRQLRYRLVDAQAEIPDEMSMFSYPLDLAEIVRNVEREIERPTLLEKLFVFAALARSPQPNTLVEQAKKDIKEHPLSSLVATTHHDREGKIVHRSAGSGAGEDASAIQRQVAQNEGVRRQVVAYGSIETARQTIAARHFLSEDLFASLLANSPFVPPHLLRTFSRGFVRFFQGDQVSSLYILTPLLEGALRHVLKSCGHDVTVFDDATQTQEDRTISSLFEQMRAELDVVFGNAITTDIDNVFLRQPGPCLRNAVAHGLLSDGSPHSHDAVYGCWLLFHLSLLPLFEGRSQISLPFDEA